MTEQPNIVYLRVETGEPGQQSLMIHVSPDYSEGLAEALASEPGTTVNSDIIELSVPEILTVAIEVVGPMAAVGATLAKVLKEWWHRNDGKRAAFTFNGEQVSLEGMSVDEMGKFMDRRRRQWDDRWRQQFPDRFPPEDYDGTTK
jgi:hypothetical protein